MAFINLIPYGMEQTQASVGNYYRMLEAERAAQRQAIDNARNRFGSALQLRALDDAGREAAERRMMVDRNWQAQERNWATGLRQRAEDIAYQRERDQVGDTFRNDQLKAQNDLRKQQMDYENSINTARINERKMDDARRLVQAELQSGESSPEQVTARAVALGLSPEEAKAFGSMTVAVGNQQALPYLQQQRAALAQRDAELSQFETQAPGESRLKFALANWRKVVGDKPVPTTGWGLPSRFSAVDNGAGYELKDRGFWSNPFPNDRSLDPSSAEDTFRTALLQRRAQLKEQQNRIDSALQNTVPEFIRRRVDGVVNQSAPEGGASSAGTVTTKAQFDALPSGAIYVGKDGRKYQKP